MLPLNRYIDHTILKAFATSADIEQLCQEAIRYDFFAVCVNGYFVSLCREQLAGSGVAVASVVGFPLGAGTTDSKVFETDNALRDGADEIDTVINLAWVKERQEKKIIHEIQALKRSIGKDKLLKVIIETCYLDEEEKKLACLWSLEGGCDYLKTSTGFGTGGATIDDVRLMVRLAGTQAKVKASGGIKNAEQAKAFVEVGASRLGLSSSVHIMQELDTSR